MTGLFGARQDFGGSKQFFYENPRGIVNFGQLLKIFHDIKYRTQDIVENGQKIEPYLVQNHEKIRKAFLPLKKCLVSTILILHFVRF